MKSYIQIIKIILFVSPGFIIDKAQAQFIVNASGNYAMLVDSFASSGIHTSNISYTGSSLSAGYFLNGNLTNLGITSGIVLSTGSAADIDNGASYFGNFNLSTSGNNLLDSLAGVSTNDASVLEFDLIPGYDTLSFNFIFASEDYNENIGSTFIDPVAAFLSGPNPYGGNYSNFNFVYVPNTSFPVSVNQVNGNMNGRYFVNNPSGAVMFDGFTTELTAKISVVPLANYHLTIAIADGGDNFYDSGIFLKGKSLRSYGAKTGIAENISRDKLAIFENPLGENSRIEFLMNKPGQVNMCLFDASGRLINTLVSQHYESGLHSLPINPSGLQNGIYILQSAIGNSLFITKLIVN